MSKLERQLDEVYGEERVTIAWPSDDEVDVDEIRAHLIREIDRHRQRVPLDLRGVNGAPESLIDLLLEAQLYAKEQDKVVAISYALPPMQDALQGRPRRSPAPLRKEKGEGDAGELAHSILKKQVYKSDPANYDLSNAEKIERSKRRRKPRSAWHRYAILSSVILGGTAIIGAIEWYLIFHEQPKGVRIPTKAFEVIGKARKYRSWTEVNGQFAVTAEFVRVENETVYLRGEDGRTLSIDIEKLSQADREHLQSTHVASPFVVE